MRILVVDDNSEIREIIRVLLRSEGYAIEEASDGEEAIKMAQENVYDLLILDIMMPKSDGYQVCLEVRKQSNVPILFLSAKSQESDKMIGFSNGGDDYLVKPFSYKELLARVTALTRRYRVYKGKESEDQQVLEIHGLRIDTKEEKVYVKDIEIKVTDVEYGILLLLCQHRKDRKSVV